MATLTPVVKLKEPEGGGEAVAAPPPAKGKAGKGIHLYSPLPVLNSPNPVLNSPQTVLNPSPQTVNPLHTVLNSPHQVLNPFPETLNPPRRL
jgi:hypothetical protein